MGEVQPIIVLYGIAPAVHRIHVSRVIYEVQPQPSFSSAVEKSMPELGPELGSVGGNYRSPSSKISRDADQAVPSMMAGAFAVASSSLRT